MFRVRFAKMKASVVLVLVFSLAATPLAAQHQSPGDDPDVQGEIRLFSAWLEGQIAYRELPGVVVGVVADQELVWARGFGLADIDTGRPMAPDTRFSDGVAQQALHRHVHHAASRAGKDSTRRPRVGLPALVRDSVGRAG